MSQNLFQKREVEKHIVNSILNRELILDLLKKRVKPINYEKLAFKLNFKSKEKIRFLRRLLQDMEKDGQLVFTNCHQYFVLPEYFGMLRGTVIGHRDGYGFLRVVGKKNDLYISSKEMKTCIHGDQVLAKQIKINRKSNRSEAHIIRVLESKFTQIIGRYFIDSCQMGYVIPNDSRLNFNILIPFKERMNAKKGYLVVVEFIQRPTRNTKPVGKIIEILGKNMDINMIINIALRTREIPYSWPSTVKKELKDLKKEETKKTENLNRVDLRKLPLVTIDNEESYDFDDGIYCEKNSDNNWKLWVAISDVSYYVRPYTSIDKEARNRGTSIYFPSRVIPMLPEILSNDLCSLNPKVDRLSLVCEMVISSKGNLINYKFYEAVINSFARLTYSTVWDILQGNQKTRKKYKKIVNQIEELYNLYKKLEKARKDRGGICFKKEEVRFIFDDKYRIKKIEQVRQNDAYKIIEECMILANVSAAHFIEKKKEPLLFRIHEKPSDESISSFRSFLNEIGVKFSKKEQIVESKDYVKLLSSVSNHHYVEILKTMLIRSMKQASYSSKNYGHFGLALSSYTHFTSPIRRYPDLLLHRIIKFLIAEKKNIKNNKITKTGGYRYSLNEIQQFEQYCSMTERRSDDVTREVIDWLKCNFMLNQIGNTFKGIIVNVTGFGFFVRITEFFVDGLVHISTLGDDFYYFDSIKQRLIGESSRRIYRLGDQVKIRVETVNVNERKIDFKIVSEETNKSIFSKRFKIRNK